jgi:hypothetical protein
MVRGETTSDSGKADTEAATSATPQEESFKIMKPGTTGQGDSSPTLKDAVETSKVVEENFQNEGATVVAARNAEKVDLAALEEAVLRDVLLSFPTPARGEREEWAARVGWHVKEPVRPTPKNVAEAKAFKSAAAVDDAFTTSALEGDRNHGRYRRDRRHEAGTKAETLKGERKESGSSAGHGRRTKQDKKKHTREEHI